MAPPVRTVGGVGERVDERGLARPDAGRGGEREELRRSGGVFARPEGEEGGTPPLLLLLLPRVVSGRSN